jgi:hypothetical protein
MYVNGKMIPVKLFQEWGSESKGERSRGEFNYDIFNIL